MTEPAPIRVFVVDDSAVAQLLLKHVLEGDPAVRHVGTAASGEQAIAAIAGLRPDVVLIDIHLPGMDGFETTRQLMERHPLPIVVCSAISRAQEAVTAFRAMECGALACVEKPVGPEHPDHGRTCAELLHTVKTMAAVKVVRRWPRARTATPPRANPVGATHVIGIGASTGGPPVLQQILAALPVSLPAPILVVQHITAGFLPGLASWLAQTTGIRVQIAAHGLPPHPGHVYLAPDDFHLGLQAGRLQLSREAPESGLRPAVDVLFRSLAEQCGAQAIGVLLTGMGKDGAQGLRLMRERGATTIAQDRDSSVVFGMPGAAVRLDAATHVLPAERIGPALIELCERSGQLKEQR